nr:uncharacterized protein LOC112795428 [Arachis hypogaea]
MNVVFFFGNPRSSPPKTRSFSASRRFHAITTRRRPSPSSSHLLTPIHRRPSPSSSHHRSPLTPLFSFSSCVAAVESGPAAVPAPTAPAPSQLVFIIALRRLCSTAVVCSSSVACAPLLPLPHLGLSSVLHLSHAIAAESRTFDENSTNPAKELGLLEENLETSVFLIQLPAALPAIIGSASSGSQDGSESSSKPQGSMKKVKPCKLNELPPGLMGKMLVYKSGAIKLKLGSTLYDVSPGSDCTFAQDVAVMNTGEKHCCAIGEISKRVIVTPDIDDMISVTRWVKPPIGKVKLNCNTSLSLAMGVAAGAYILTLFAMKYRQRVLGLILVSPLCKEPSWTEWLCNKILFLYLKHYVVL